MAIRWRRWPLLGTGLVVGSLLTGAAAGDVRLTPHNLAQRASGAAASDAREVCVFCHTPNEPARREQHPAVPKWQSALPAEHAFAIYDDIGRIGLEGSGAIGSQSVACLSCHDANQALSVTKFTFDHPFGVPYRGIPQRTAGATKGRGEDEVAHRAAKHATAQDSFRPAVSGIVENRTVWWVPTGGNRLQRGRSDIPLFSRRDAAGAEEKAFIECASCHDPHSTNKLFLRIPDGGSRLCLSCHDA